MSDGDALLSAILASPEEDVPRLVYADWLDEVGGESDRARADLIRVQIALARASSTDRPLDLEASEKRLLATYRTSWLAPFQAEGGPLRGHAAHGQFHRGFVETVWLPATWFVARAEQLFACVPARELRVMHTTIEELAALVASA